jgi:hypothetical protein
VKKAFDSAFSKAANSSRARLAVLATTMLVLGIALSTGAAALATDSRDQTSTYSTTDRSTTDTRTTSTTSTSTTSTSVPSTVSVAGTTAAGVAPAPAAGGGPGGGQGGGGGAPAAQAPAGNGQLPFTGVHVPALIVIALGMIAGGIALRRKLEDSA